MYVCVCRRVSVGVCVGRWGGCVYYKMCIVQLCVCVCVCASECGCVCWEVGGCVYYKMCIVQLCVVLFFVCFPGHTELSVLEGVFSLFSKF